MYILRIRKVVHITLVLIATKMSVFMNHGASVMLKKPMPRPSKKPVENLKRLLLCLKSNACEIQSAIDGRDRISAIEKPILNEMKHVIRRVNIVTIIFRLAKPVTMPEHLAQRCISLPKTYSVIQCL